MPLAVLYLVLLIPSDDRAGAPLGRRTAAEHMPLYGSIIGVVVNGFYCQQISGDSGSGTRILGDFRGHTIGIGPAVSYAAKASQKDLVAEIK